MTPKLIDLVFSGQSLPENPRGDSRVIVGNIELIMGHLVGPQVLVDGHEIRGVKNVSIDCRNGYQPTVKLEIVPSERQLTSTQSPPSFSEMATLAKSYSRARHDFVNAMMPLTFEKPEYLLEPSGVGPRFVRHSCLTVKPIPFVALAT